MPIYSRSFRDDSWWIGPRRKAHYYILMSEYLLHTIEMSFIDTLDLFAWYL